MALRRRRRLTESDAWRIFAEERGRMVTSRGSWVPRPGDHPEWGKKALVYRLPRRRTEQMIEIAEQLDRMRRRKRPKR